VYLRRGLDRRTVCAADCCTNFWYDISAMVQTVDDQERRICSTEQTIAPGWSRTVRRDHVERSHNRPDGSYTVLWMGGDDAPVSQVERG